MVPPQIVESVGSVLFLIFDTPYRVTKERYDPAPLRIREIREIEPASFLLNDYFVIVRNSMAQKLCRPSTFHSHDVVVLHETGENIQVLRTSYLYCTQITPKRQYNTLDAASYFHQPCDTVVPNHTRSTCRVLQIIARLQTPNDEKNTEKEPERGTGEGMWL